MGRPAMSQTNKEDTDFNSSGVTLPNTGGLSDEVLATLKALFGARTELEAIQLEEARERNRIAKEQKEVEKAAKLAAIEAIKLEEANKKLKQQFCSHRLPENRGTRLGGQRNSKNEVILVCMECQKLYYPAKGDYIPEELRPNSEYVGGPIG